MPMWSPTAIETTTGTTERRRSGAVVVAAAAAGVTAVGLAWSNPAGWGVTLCPFKAATGWDCPFCGGLRATHDLLTGQLAAAADQNLLVVAAVAVALVLVVLGVVRRVQRGSWPPLPSVSTRQQWLLLALLGVFWVVRNLPGVPFLGSGVG